MCRKNICSRMSVKAEVLHTLSEGVQCELGQESYRNCIAALGSKVSALASGIDQNLDLKQEEIQLTTCGNSIETGKFHGSKSEDDEDRRVGVVAQPMILARSNAIEICEYVCGDCGLQYPDEASYEVHCKAHCAIEPFKCVECSRRYKECISLEEHRTSHLLVKQHMCMDCKKSYSFKWSLMMHSRRHHHKPQYQCLQCRLVFLTADFLSSHVLLHSVEGYSLEIDLKSLNLLVCDEENESHSRIVLKSVLECEDCDLQFGTHEDFSNHLMMMHRGPLSFKCEECSTTFTDYFQLRKHVDSSHDDTDMHWCEDCGGTGFINGTIINEDSCVKTEGNIEDCPKNQNENSLHGSNMEDTHNDDAKSDEYTMSEMDSVKNNCKAKKPDLLRKKRMSTEPRQKTDKVGKNKRGKKHCLTVSSKVTVRNKGESHDSGQKLKRKVAKEHKKKRFQ